MLDPVDDGAPLINALGVFLLYHHLVVFDSVFTVVTIDGLHPTVMGVRDAAELYDFMLEQKAEGTILRCLIKRVRVRLFQDGYQTATALGIFTDLLSGGLELVFLHLFPGFIGVVTEKNLSHHKRMRIHQVNKIINDRDNVISP